MTSSQSTAVAAAYQIEKSLRFNDDDSAYLKKELGAESNRRTWTWAGWVKKCRDSDQVLLEADNGTASFISRIQLDSESNLSFLEITDGSVTLSLKTTALLRDHSAWYHVVVALDTTDPISSERAKIYINGKRQTSFSTETYPAQNLETRINSLEAHTIGRQDCTTNKYLDSYLADVHFIDGLALSPAAFGEFSSDGSGVFNPKAFALPTPNQNVTHSSTMVSSTGSWQTSNHTSTAAFDGLRGQGASGSSARPSTSTATVTWTPTTEIPFTHSVQARSNACTVELTLTDDSVIKVQAANDEHKYLYYGNSKIKSIKWTPVGSVYTDIQAIWVDGILLVDGEYDVTTFYNANDGTNWSSGTSVGTIHGAWANLFDGLTDSSAVAASGNSGASVELTLPAPISWKSKLRVLSWLDHASCKIELTIGGTTTDYANLFTANPAASEWKTITTTAGSLTKIKLTSHESGGSNNRARLYAIEADGHIIIDSAVENSYHLKFNDTSTNAALGNNSILGSVNSPDIAGAILKVKTDSTDFDLDSGVNSDPDKSHLVLAIAGNTIADHSHTIKGSGSAVALTANGGAAASTAQSKFYGASMYFDGDGDYIDTAAIDTDNKFCMEYWMRPELIQDSRPFNGSDDLNGNYYLYTELLDNGGVKCRQGAIGIITSGAAKISVNTWHHIAYTYDGTTQRLFIDGVLEASATGSWTAPADMKFRLGADEGVATANEYKGYIQDARFYFGTAKYTAAFTPVPGNFKVNNLTTATRSYSDNNQLLPDSDSDQTGVPSTGANASGAFDGNAGTNFAVERKDGTGTGNVGGVWTPSPKITGVTSLHFSGFQQSNTDIRVNEGSWTAMSGLTGYSAGSNTAWLTCDSLITNSEITKIEFRRTSISPNYGTNMAGIKINGTQLVNIGTKDVDTSTDSPTNYAPSSGDDKDGGVTRGNYCTFNPLSLDSNIVLAQGNLQATISDNLKIAKGTIGLQNSGKWYFEVECISDSADNNKLIGVHFLDGVNEGYVGQNYSVGYHKDGRTLYAGGQAGSTGSTWGAGDTIGVALDLSGGASNNGKVTFYKNGTAQSNGIVTTLDCTRPWTVAVNRSGSGSGSTVFSLNSGQRAFKNAAPADHKCLCTQNLPDTFSGDALNNPSKYFDIKTWSGTGADHDIKGFSFQPDLVWIKNRTDDSQDHSVHDAARGAARPIYTNAAPGETLQTSNIELKQFNSDGFRVADNNRTNGSSKNYVGFAWDAGTAGAANTAGTIDVDSPNQWANQEAGFSITKYEGNNTASQNIGHGLSNKPEFMILKKSETTGDWHVGFDVLTWEKHLYLGGSTGGADTVQDDANVFSDTAPTNTLWYTGANGSVNGNNHDHICYAWTPIQGFSSFGSFVGNGSADGPFVYTGFRPRWIMMKNTSTARDWVIWDTKRSPGNYADECLFPNVDDAEATRGPLSGTDNDIDILSNGFKIRNVDSAQNGNGDTVVYAAFAEHPFKTARAR